MCRCDCGVEKVVIGDSLRSGNTQSCGCYQQELVNKDITGQRFFKLVGVRKTDRKKRSNWIWECRCDCGNPAYVATGELVSGNTKSCGCLHAEVMKTKQIWEDQKVARKFFAAERRARVKQQTPAWSDREELRKIYIGCPEGLHVDHIVPISGRNVCGLHVPHNLQYLTATENSKKSNSHVS